MPKNFQGILWALAATALFAISAAMAKVVVVDYHVLQILFFRQVIVFVSVIPAAVKSYPDILNTNHPVTHGIRLVGAFVALASGIWAVSVLPLSTATTLAFSQIFFVTILARQCLREPVSWNRLLAIIIGFVGVMIVLRPGLSGIADLNALIPIIGALGAAVAVICVRKLSQIDTTATLLFYQAIVVGVMSGIPLFWLWVTPDWTGFLIMASIGGVATVAQWVGIRALREGEASLISSIGYMQLIYAALLGTLFFSEIPDTFTLIGATVIIGSALFTIWREASNHASGISV